MPSGWGRGQGGGVGGRGRQRGGPGYLRKLVLQARQPVEFLHLNVAPALVPVHVRALGAEVGCSCWH